MIALQNDSGNQIFSEINSLYIRYSNELSTTSDTALAESLRACIGILDEIKETCRNYSSNSDAIRTKLLAALNSNRLTKLSYLAIEQGLSQQNISQMNLLDKLATAELQARTILQLISKEKISTETSIQSKKNQISHYTRIRDQSESDIRNYKKKCTELDTSFSVDLPRKIGESRSSIDTNTNYLDKQGCQKKHCTWMENELGLVIIHHRNFVAEADKKFQESEKFRKSWNNICFQLQLFNIAIRSFEFKKDPRLSSTENA